MRWLFLFLLVCGVAHAEPRPIPIILVHGFAGWGIDEVAGYRYWGGTGLDVERFLNRHGFPCATGSVSPIASNHDRACQLFAQIKGGTVDFGEEHARKFGHARYGRTYPKPLYPWWSEKHPLHFLTHSMGGQTVRVLIDLLERGHFGPQGNGRWVLSCTTISTPHNGTTLAEVSRLPVAGWTQKVMAGLLKLAGSKWPTYDLDLDHWGFKARSGESWAAAWMRAQAQLADTKDFSLWDLHAAGAKELNQRVGTHPDVFYMTFANEETFKLFGRQMPSPVMDPWMIPFASFMGMHRSPHVAACDRWFMNDGIVNTVSMSAPSGQPWRAADGKVQRGTFNYMGLIRGKDHLKVVGHYQDPLFTGRWMRGFYLALARNLQRLALAPRTERAVQVESVPHP